MSRSDWGRRPRGLEQAAEELRDKLGRFAGRPRFDRELEEAFDFYFGHGISEFSDSLGEAEFLRFLDWFIHDYPLSNGHRLIEVFDLEHGAELPAEERALLREWMNAHLTLLEVVAERDGVWACVDLLTGRRYDAVRFAGEPPLRWSIVVARPLAVGKTHLVSAAAARLAPSVKEILLEHLRGEYRRYCLERRGASVEEFLRENGYCFDDLLAELTDWIAAARAQDEQAHRMVHARAVYRLRDPEGVAARLRAYGDIAQVRPGRLVLREREEDKARTLAEIRLAEGRMFVRCWSPERLEQAKRVLASRLGGLVHHLVDAYEEHGLKPVDGDSGQALKRRQPEACAEFVEDWLGRPHPGLNGLPPKRVAALPLGRLRVAELLKRMEYHERAWPGSDGPWAVQELRRRLGLTDEDGVVLPLDAQPHRWNRDSEKAVLDEFYRVAAAQLRAEHLSSGAWIWWNFCSLAYPVIRKPGAWAAAVHYCVGLVENRPLRWDELAALYGVRAASISKNSWKIVDTLYLQPYDDRYSVFTLAGGLFRRLVPALAAEAGGSDGEDDGLSASLAKAARLRDAIARCVVGANPGLQEKAYAFFASHVGSGQASRWEEMFLDWYHFDWRVPVMGGRTFVEQAYLYGDLGEEESGALLHWIGRHPSFYVVEGVEEESSRLVLVDLMDQERVAVDWLRLAQPVGPGDVLFARLVPIDGLTVSIGPVLAFPPRYREGIQNALQEDRALVERWNGRALSWDEFNAHYSERLYALALRGVYEAGIDLEDD